MLTRKLALEFWIVGIASAILLAIAVMLQGSASSAAEDLGAAEGGRLAQPMDRDVKDFMVRAALASAAGINPAAADADVAPASVPALSRAAVAPRAAPQKARAPRLASAIPPLEGPAIDGAELALNEGPWRLVEDKSEPAKYSQPSPTTKRPL